MSEVEVETTNAVAPRNEPGINLPDFFAPAFPPGRFFDANPFAAMREFTNEMNRFFKSTLLPAGARSPAVDVQRCNGNLVVTAELPGLKKEEIRVAVMDGALTIQGERKREHKEDHEGFHRYERSYGNFYRVVPLPEGARTEEIKAELNEGVLKISVPAPEGNKAVRQVAINTA